MFKKRIRYFSILVRMGGVCYHAAISAKCRVERGDCLAPNTERRMRAKRQVLPRDSIYSLTVNPQKDPQRSGA